MALQLNLPADQNAVGLDAPDAYARVVKVERDLAAGKTTVTVFFYASEKARRDSRNPILGAAFEGGPDLDHRGGEFIHACYEWLKTLPAFAGVKDV